MPTNEELLARAVEFSVPGRPDLRVIKVPTTGDRWRVVSTKHWIRVGDLRLTGDQEGTSLEDAFDLADSIAAQG